MNRSHIAVGCVIAGLGILGAGCFERALRPVNPCTRSNVGDTIRVESVDEVDLLFMIDNSNSMAEEQASLTAELPRLVRVLASGDINADGMQEFQPVRSLHIGIINSDMGTGGHAVPTCANGAGGTASGDDGVLITEGQTSRPGCSASYPPVFEFLREGTVTADAFAASVACVAAVGTGGCGFEQQLDAVLKAVSPSVATSYTVPGYIPPTFFGGSLGHGDRMNAGFVRENSALAIILVSDEEDCSALDPNVFDPASPVYGGTDLNLRCFTYPATQHPIERYVRGEDPTRPAGLLGLRQNPSLLIFAAIVGVPVASVPDPDNVDYAAILAHPDMVEMVDPTMMTRLRPSCNVPGRGIAFPPTRIVRTAQAIAAAGGSATVQSICQERYDGALNAIISKIADALGGACLPRDLNPDAEGFVDCQVFEILPTTGDTTACAQLETVGRISAGTTVVNGVVREMCEVQQVGPAGGNGWFYETAEMMLPGSNLGMTCGSEGQRISFGAINPVTNSEIRLECLQTVQPPSTGGGMDSIGSFCSQTDVCNGFGPSGTEFPLACDFADRTCGVPCTDTSQCTAAGLLGDVCDNRPWTVVVEGSERLIEQLTAAGVDVNAPHNFCVNPTCL
jgi:hypothetical protein